MLIDYHTRISLMWQAEFQWTLWPLLAEGGYHESLGQGF
jgi:hypothetical protein